MASEYDGTEMVVCPYDKTHCIAVARLTFHVNKCRKNHPHIDIKMCPFNARHYIENHMYQHHLLHCSDRAVIDREIMHSSGVEDGTNYSGKVSLPMYDNYCGSEENWDEEPAFASYRWNSNPSNQSLTQVRQPRQEPAVLDSQDQAEMNRRLEERRQSRQVNTSNAFLSRSDNVRAGANGDSTSVNRANGAANGGVVRHSFAGPVPSNNGASGVNGDTAGVGALSASGASGGNGAIGRGAFRESQTTGQNVLAGLGRGMAAQGPVAASTSPVPASVGQGQAALTSAQPPQQQPRKVTQTMAFTLPGVGRGFSTAGRGGGGAPGNVDRPGQSGR